MSKHVTFEIDHLRSCLFVAMKLMTHNMLQSPIPNVTNGFPLVIEAQKVQTTQTDFKPDFLRGYFPKLDWNAFRAAAASVGLTDYPDEVSEEMLKTDDFLKKLHHGLLEVSVEEGFLICPESGHRFSISNGIPNLLAPFTLKAS